MRANKKKFVAAGIVATIVLLAAWGIHVVRLNRHYRELDEVPVENYAMGEFVSFDHNYSYGYYFDGYSMRVNDYEILDTDVYLKRHNKTMDEYPMAFENVCIVDLTVRYDEVQTKTNTSNFVKDSVDNGPGEVLNDTDNDSQNVQNGSEDVQDSSEEEIGLGLGDFWLCGLSYYFGQNWDFFNLENPKMNGCIGIILEDGQEYDIRLVYNLDDTWLKPSSWAHIDQLPLMIYLTAYPVQKNIILHQ